MAKNKQNAFTIIELLVAMTLLLMMLGLSGMVFNTAVKTQRAAAATIDISRKLRALTSQLTSDFRGLRKDGEILMIWVPEPERDEKNAIIDEDGNGIPDNYFSYDRVVFFANGDFQTMRQQGYDTNTDGTIDGYKTVTGNLARISYMLANKADGTQAALVPDWKRRILGRTQHIITADSDLPLFPNPAALTAAAWDPAAFKADNFLKYEYQTMSMGDWDDMSDPSHACFAAKNDILSILTDIVNILATTSNEARALGGGTTVEIGDPNTYHNLFTEGVRDFRIQIWLDSQQRWFPEIDPNHDGDYSDTTDYYLNGSEIDVAHVVGFFYDGKDVNNLQTNTGIPLRFTALKFTFTLCDSRGVFPEGRTFTHIVYLDN